MSAAGGGGHAKSLSNRPIVVGEAMKEGRCKGGAMRGRGGKCLMRRGFGQPSSRGSQHWPQLTPAASLIQLSRSHEQWGARAEKNRTAAAELRPRDGWRGQEEKRVRSIHLHTRKPRPAQATRGARFHRVGVVHEHGIFTGERLELRRESTVEPSPTRAASPPDPQTDRGKRPNALLYRHFGLQPNIRRRRACRGVHSFCCRLACHFSGSRLAWNTARTWMESFSIIKNTPYGKRLAKARRIGAAAIANDSGRRLTAASVASMALRYSFPKP